jgi:alcohol dehydrogenase class IV
VNTAAVHALSYPLGSSFHLPHGLSNAMLLPFVMEFNIPAAVDRYADVAVALGCERDGDAMITALKGVERIRTLIRECGIPSTLKELGIPRESIPGMAADAMKIVRLLKNNPRPVAPEDAIGIYKSAYE